MFSDFDGTLALIVPDPPAARPYDDAVTVLERLARRYGRVGVISGRPGSFLNEHLGGMGLFLSGLYGLEEVVDGEVRAVADAKPWRAVADAAADRATAALPGSVTVERKGLSFTLHFRDHPESEAAARECAEEISVDSGLVIHEARMSLELRPPLRCNKGTVLESAADGLGAVCFAGDDLGDLEAFDALDRLAARGTATLRIGVESPEAPPELLERSDLVVDGPAGTLALLRCLLGGPG